MHPSAYAFISHCRQELADISRLHILEFGAHNVNGSPRPIFAGCRLYVGLDPWPGPGVDLVARAQDIDYDQQYDLVISAEVLEHDPDWTGHIQAAHRALKPGGHLILTCATHPRPPHRCDGREGDLQGEYYKNIDWQELWTVLVPAWHVIAFSCSTPGDIYAFLQKKESES